MSFIKNFLDWFKLKPKLDNLLQRPLFQEREVWWCSIGVNIGCETDGKNQLYERPVLIFKKYNKNQFLALPLTTTTNVHPIYHSILTVRRTTSQVMLSQGRTLDAKRLIRKISKLTTKEFEKVKNDWQKSMQ
jgi:mRNA interferase MazF